jgi:hypothetical protein
VNDAAMQTDPLFLPPFFRGIAVAPCVSETDPLTFIAITLLFAIEAFQTELSYGHILAGFALQPAHAVEITALRSLPSWLSLSE